MNRDGMSLIFFGFVSIISVITPDKSFGMSIGIGLILIGLCVITTKDNVKVE
jgi:hypothetical protein